MKLRRLLNEITYREYKGNKSISSKQKLNIAIKECNRALFEIERYLKQNKKLREEEGLGLTEYWKSTAYKLVRMDERLSNLRKEIKKFGLKEIVANLAAEERVKLESEEIKSSKPSKTLKTEEAPDAVFDRAEYDKYMKQMVAMLGTLDSNDLNKLFKFIMKTDPAMTSKKFRKILNAVGNESTVGSKTLTGTDETIKTEIENYFGL